MDSVLFKFYGLLQYVDFALNYCRHLLPVLQQLQCNFEESIAPFSQVSLFLWSTGNIGFSATVLYSAW